VMQCDALCCSVLLCNTAGPVDVSRTIFISHMCCSVLQCVAMCCTIFISHMWTIHVTHDESCHTHELSHVTHRNTHRLLKKLNEAAGPVDVTAYCTWSVISFLQS